MPHVSLLDDRQVADAFARQFYVLRGQIYPGCDGSVLCKLQQISSRSASDFENLFTRDVCETPPTS